MRLVCAIVIALIFIGCKEKVSKPSFISFKTENDTLKVLAKNTLACPMFVKIENRQSQDVNTVQLKVNETKAIQHYKASETDSLQILNTYKFAGYYGIHDFRQYDTLYNYVLPFKSGYKSAIIQGYDGSFSHKGQFSAKTLDFKMNVGDTILASRSGVVIKVIDSHNKQGTTDEFRKYGNYIMVYHKDNTFSQYVHLKQK